MNHNPISPRALFLLALLAATGGLTARAQNVGVGTLTPGQKLDVVGGNIRISTSGSTLIFPDGTTQGTAATPANLTGDVTSTGAATTYNGVVPAAKGGAGTVSGLLKANGSGTVSAATAGTDYLTPAGANAAYIQNAPATQQTGSFNLSGTGTLGGNINATGAVLKNAANGFIELQTTSATATTPYIDFSETSGTPDYSTRLISSGGVLTLFNQAGGGSQSWQVNGAAGVTGNSAVGGNETVGGNSTVGGAVQAGTSVVVDAAGANTGTTANALRFGAGNTGEGIGSKRSATGNQSGLDFYTGFNNRMSISNGGNVGIGTTSPFSRLSMGGTDNANAPAGRLAIYENANGQNFYGLGLVQNTGGSYGTGLWGSSGSALPYSGSAGGTLPQLFVQGGGNVGIGTISPATTLDVRTTDGTARLTVGTTGGTGGGIAFGNPGHGIQRGYPTLNADNNVGFYTTAGNLYLAANGAVTNQFVLTNGGNVGIGTSTPRGAFDVAGTGDTYITSNPANSGGQSLFLSGHIFVAPFQGGTYSYIQARGIANQGFIFRSNSGGNFVDAMRIAPDGATFFQNDVFAPAFRQISDARFKTNVRPLAGALASVLALRGVSYDWNALGIKHGGTAGAKQVGFIAQELEKLYPELVATDKDGFKSVNYSQLTPVLIEAIKEQQAQIEALKQQNAALQTGAAADHASLLTLQAQMARLLGGEVAPAGAQARK